MEGKSEENQKTLEEIVDKEEKKAKAKKRKIYFDGIMTLVGSQLHSIGFGSVYALMSLHTYLISYLRYYQKGNKTLTLQYIYFIGLVMSISRGVFTPFVSIFENKLGLLKSIILGSLIDMFGTAIIYFSKNYYLDLLGYLIISLGQSLTALRRRNVMSYFFHVRGKLSGIISVINSFVTSGYNIVCEKWIVNPKSENPKYDEVYYDINVAKNVLKFIEFIWCCTGVATLISLLFIVPFDPEKHEKGLFAPIKDEKEKIEEKKDEKIDKNEEKIMEKNDNNDENNTKFEPLVPGSINDDNEDENEEKKEEKEKEENKEGNKEENEDKDNEEIENKKEDKKLGKTSSSPANIPIGLNEDILKINENSTEKRSQTLANPHKKDSNNELEPHPRKKTIHNRFDIKVMKKALKSKRVLRLFLMGIFSSPLGNFFMNTWRPLGIRKGIHTRYLQNIGTYSPFTMFSSSFIFSFLSDYIPFRYIVPILSLCSSAVGILFCFSLHNPTFFTIVVLANTFFGMGAFAVYEPHYLKVFGIKHYIELGGIISLAGVIMGPICTVFIFIFENIFADSIKDENGSDLPYYVLFIASALLNCVSSILGFFEPEDEIYSE